jgi:hypothetical protein
MERGTAATALMTGIPFCTHLSDDHDLARLHAAR